MKIVFQLSLILASLAGTVGLTRFLSDNRQLSAQIDQLEAELGRMSVDDRDRLYVVEIDTPDVPPEVALHLEGIWQFRCYLPAGYDFVRFHGDGRVAKEGVYLAGGFGSNWASPKPEATHQLLTVSLQRKDSLWEVFCSFGGSSETFSWGKFNPDDLDKSVVMQKLASSKSGPRSFGQDVILPLLKIFDPTTAEEKNVAGKKLTTYSGWLCVLCPRTRETQFNQLARGNTPVNFDPSWIAAEADDE